jgi:Yip1 domain
VGWERFLHHQMETNVRVQQQMERIPAEKRDATIAMQTKFVGIGYYFSAIVMVPLIYLIQAATVLGIASGLMSAGVKFKQLFAIVCYAGLPSIVMHALATVVMYLKSPDEFNLANPLAFNPAAFMDPISTPKFLYTLAMSLDLFTIWTLLLIAIGLKAAAGKRLSFGGALFAVVLPWAVLLLIGATLAGMFS